MLKGAISAPDIFFNSCNLQTSDELNNLETKVHVKICQTMINSKTH